MSDHRSWVAAQRAFIAGHLAQAGSARRRVKVRWWTPQAPRRADVTGLVARLWSGRAAVAGEGPLQVAVYEAADPVGAPPFLVVRVAAVDLGAPSGRATATLHGDGVPGGALAVEVRNALLVPLAPPLAPDDDAPGWTEVDAAP